MKSLLTRLERWLTAITFAEANEHETARQILVVSDSQEQNSGKETFAGRQAIHSVGA